MRAYVYAHVYAHTLTKGFPLRVYPIDSSLRITDKRGVGKTSITNNAKGNRMYTAQVNAHGNIIVCKGSEVRNSYKIVFTGTYAECRNVQVNV